MVLDHKKIVAFMLARIDERKKAEKARLDRFAEKIADSVVRKLKGKK